MKLSLEAQLVVNARSSRWGASEDVIVSSALERYQRILSDAMPRMAPDEWATVFRAISTGSVLRAWSLVEDYSGRYPDSASKASVLDLYDRWMSGASSREAGLELGPWEVVGWPPQNLDGGVPLRLRHRESGDETTYTVTSTTRGRLD